MKIIFLFIFLDNDFQLKAENNFEEDSIEDLNKMFDGQLNLEHSNVASTFPTIIAKATPTGVITEMSNTFNSR